MESTNTKYLIALTVAVILVAGALTLPLAFDEQSADAKKSKKYKKTTKKTKKASIEAEGGNGGDGGDGGTSTGGNGGAGTGGAGGSSLSRSPPSSFYSVNPIDCL